MMQRDVMTGQSLFTRDGQIQQANIAMVNATASRRVATRARLAICASRAKPLRRPPEIIWESFRAVAEPSV